MSKAKFRSPFLAVLRCKFRSSTTNFPNITDSCLSSYISRSQLSPRVECSRLSCPSTGHEFLDNFRFSFCSQSVKEADSKIKCWNCGIVSPAGQVFLVCESCRSIQPVDQSVNYFQIFGLEKVYEIGDVNLERKYKDWQKQLHPDLVHSKSDKEREYAAEQSARVIDAYRTLSKPLSRAIYILKLEGVEIDEEDTVSEPQLLNEVLEIREAVEDASGSQALNQIRNEMQEKLNHLFYAFSKAFQNRNFNDAVLSIQRMNYYERVNEEITKKL